MPYKVVIGVQSTKIFPTFAKIPLLIDLQSPVSPKWLIQFKKFKNTIFRKFNCVQRVLPIWIGMVPILYTQNTRNRYAKNHIKKLIPTCSLVKILCNTANTSRKDLTFLLAQYYILKPGENPCVLCVPTPPLFSLRPPPPPFTTATITLAAPKTFISIFSFLDKIIIISRPI